MSDANQPILLSESTLAYLNSEFLKGPEARVLRILSEYLEPAARLRQDRIRDTIVFFGSARSVSPEVAIMRQESLKQRIDETGSMTPELEAEQSRVEYTIKLARYYADAM